MTFEHVIILKHVLLCVTDTNKSGHSFTLKLLNKANKDIVQSIHIFLLHEKFWKELQTARPMEI